MEKDNLLQLARNINITDILNHYGYYANKYGQYICVGHDDTNPSSSVYESRNKLHCFVCKKFYTTIDIVSIMENDRDLRSCAKKVLEISNVSFEAVSNANKQVKSNNNTTKKKKLTIQDRINMLDKSKDCVVEDYLKSRGINPNIVLPILQKNNYIYGADKLGQVTFIFKRFDCCIIRHKQKNENWVTGNNVPITITADKKDKAWYIVEGLYDALSLVNFNCNVICLNSVSNVTKLKDLVLSNKERMSKFEYIIATDNDEPGAIAKDELKKFFNENNINHKEYEILYNSVYKDINDLLKNGMLKK